MGYGVSDESGLSKNVTVAIFNIDERLPIVQEAPGHFDTFFVWHQLYVRPPAYQHFVESTSRSRSDECVATGLIARHPTNKLFQQFVKKSFESRYRIDECRLIDQLAFRNRDSLRCQKIFDSTTTRAEARDRNSI
jgi:hypothetical protein